MGGKQVIPSLIHGLVKLLTILHKGARTKAPSTKPHRVRAKVLGMDLQPSKLGLGLGMNAEVKDM